MAIACLASGCADVHNANSGLGSFSKLKKSDESSTVQELDQALEKFINVPNNPWISIVLLDRDSLGADEDDWDNPNSDGGRTRKITGRAESCSEIIALLKKLPDRCSLPVLWAVTSRLDDKGFAMWSSVENDRIVEHVEVINDVARDVLVRTWALIMNTQNQNGACICLTTNNEWNKWPNGMWRCSGSANCAPMGSRWGMSCEHECGEGGIKGVRDRIGQRGRVGQA